MLELNLLDEIPINIYEFLEDCQYFISTNQKIATNPPDIYLPSFVRENQISNINFDVSHATPVVKEKITLIRYDDSEEFSNLLV